MVQLSRTLKQSYEAAGMLASRVHSRRKRECTPSTLGYYEWPRVWRKLARPAQAKGFALIYSPSAEEMKLQPKMHVTRLQGKLVHSAGVDGPLFWEEEDTRQTKG